MNVDHYSAIVVARLHRSMNASVKKKTPPSKKTKCRSRYSHKHHIRHNPTDDFQLQNQKDDCHLGWRGGRLRTSFCRWTPPAL